MSRTARRAGIRASQQIRALQRRTEAGQLRLSAQVLGPFADLPRQQISIAGHDDSVQRCEGVPLTGVLTKAGLSAVSKLQGKYLRKVALSSSMGPGVKVDVAEVASA